MNKDIAQEIADIGREYKELLAWIVAELPTHCDANSSLRYQASLQVVLEQVEDKLLAPLYSDQTEPKPPRFNP